MLAVSEILVRLAANRRPAFRGLGSPATGEPTPNSTPRGAPVASFPLKYDRNPPYRQTGGRQVADAPRQAAADPLVVSAASCIECNETI